MEKNELESVKRKNTKYTKNKNGKENGKKKPKRKKKEIRER